MAAKRMDLKKRTFLVLSGSSNPLGQSLALEFCKRLATGSLALILDENEQQLRSLEEFLQHELKPQTIGVRMGKLDASHSNGADLMDEALVSIHDPFERTIIIHNEGEAATQVLMEPQATQDWKSYVQQQLYAPVALNQRWLHSKELAGVEKLAVNVTSSLMIRPLIHVGLLCSCKRARNMYFRAMAAEESRSGVHVLSFAPGLLSTHQKQCDENGNELNPEELVTTKRLLELPRIQPLQATLKLINILEEISFVSGHDVDYYDTFVLWVASWRWAASLPDSLLNLVTDLDADFDLIAHETETETLNKFWLLTLILILQVLLLEKDANEKENEIKIAFIISYKMGWEVGKSIIDLFFLFFLVLFFLFSV